MTFLGDLYWVISAVMIKLGLSYIGYHQYFKYCKSTIGNVRPWYGPDMYAIVWWGKRLLNQFPYICRVQLIHLLKPIFAQLKWSLKYNLTLDLVIIGYSIWQLNMFYIVVFLFGSIHVQYVIIIIIYYEWPWPCFAENIHFIFMTNRIV